MLKSRIHRRKPNGKPIPEGMARAQAKLTLANLAYNFDRLIFQKRLAAAE